MNACTVGRQRVRHANRQHYLAANRRHELLVPAAGCCAAPMCGGVTMLQGPSYMKQELIGTESTTQHHKSHSHSRNPPGGRPARLRCGRRARWSRPRGTRRPSAPHAHPAGARIDCRHALNVSVCTATARVGRTHRTHNTRQRGRRWAWVGLASRAGMHHLLM